MASYLERSTLSYEDVVGRIDEILLSRESPSELHCQPDFYECSVCLVSGLDVVCVSGGADLFDSGWTGDHGLQCHDA